MEFGKPLHYLARDLAGSRAGLRPALAINSIMLSRSQTWFPTCHGQVPAISTCRDSSNVVADRFRPYSTTLSCSLVGHRPLRDQIPLRCLACDQLASKSQLTGLRPASELDSVMEFGFDSANRHISECGGTRGGTYDPPKLELARDFCTLHITTVQSFGSYRVDKQTDKLTNRRR